MAHLAHYREAHPLPFRITHWINLICMILLIISGIVIHNGFAFMGMWRGVHIFCGIVIFLNCIVRIVLSFFVKSAPNGGTRETVTDFWTWLPQKSNKHQLISWIKYYLFLKKDHPLSAKLGVPQKLSYLLIGVALLFMGYTGFCLWDTTAEIPLFAGFTYAVGGLMKVRIIHYFMMYFFICFIGIHVYLANIEGLAPTKLMFFGKEAPGLTYDTKTDNISGYDPLDQAPEDYSILPEEEEEEEAKATA